MRAEHRRGLRYEPGLDGLRALAVLAVLAFHDGRLRGGFLGVSTFFTLSGFLITRLLLAEWEASEHISLRRFYARRIRRLLPAALVGLVLAAAVTAGLRDPQTSRAFRLDGLAAFANVANWRFLWSGRAYADLFATPSALQHYWSLSVEEQFYLLLAPLIVAVFALARGRRVLVGAVLAVLAALSFVDGWMLVAHGVDRAYYGTDTRALEFLTGAILAVVMARRALGRRSSRVVAGIGVLALVGMALATTQARVTDIGLFRGGLLAYALGGCALVVAACEPGPVRALCTLAPLRGLGRISYGVYVYHWPLFLWLTPARTGLAPMPLTAVRVAATLVVATVSYVFFEQPIREGRLRVPGGRWVVAPSAVATVMLSALVVGVVAPEPAITFAAARPPALILSAAKVAEATPPTEIAAPATAKPTEVNAVHRVFVVGDSVALTLGRGIERWGAKHGVFVWNGGALGCTLLDGVPVRGYWGVQTRPFDSCRTHETFPEVIKKFDPDVVVVLYGAWDVYDASFDHGHTWSAPGGAVWDAHYAAVVSDAVRRLTAGGARVLWLAPPCFASHPGAPDAGAVWYDPARVEAIGSVVRSVAARVGFTVSNVVHDEGCPVDMRARPDGTHYSDAGADQVVTRLGPEIERVGREVVPRHPLKLAVGALVMHPSRTSLQTSDQGLARVGPTSAQRVLNPVAERVDPRGMTPRLRRAWVVALAAAATVPIATGAATAAGPLTVASLPATPAFQPNWVAPIRESDAPDPDVVRVGSTYYAYTTGTTWGNHIGILTSTHPDTGWRTITGTRWGSSAFPQIPPSSSVRPWQVNGSQHAPGVFRIAGRYVMFYTAQTTSGHAGHYCLSVATASSPAGPFADGSSGPLLCRDAEGGAIDPDPFVDASGQPWLVFKTYDDINHGSIPARIYVVTLTADGLHVGGAPRIALAQENLSSPFETVENPQMIRAAGKYLLVFSRGLYTSSAYRQGYATCDGPAGPCHEASSSLVTSYGAVVGPGGGTAFTDTTGRSWLAYAGWNAPCDHYLPDNSCARRLFVAPLTVTGPIVCHAVAPVIGYRMVASDGGIFVFGNQQFCGSTGGSSLNSSVVGMARTKSGGGYWLVASDGGIFAFGDAKFYGSTGAIHLNQPIVGMTASPTGRGYWFVARDGGIFAFGDAKFYGSTGAIHLNQPIVGMAATPSGHGYWLVASDGGIFAFGDAKFYGSTGAIRLNQPIVGMAASRSGHGYWFVARDGGIFAFGDAKFYGSTGAIRLNQPIVGMAASRTGHGYWFVARDGGIFAFGDATFYGSTGGIQLARPIVGIS